MSDLSPAVKAAILRAVAAEQHPKLALPNIAHRHKVTLGELQALLQKHGWPRPDSMRRAAQLIEDTAGAGSETPRPLSVAPAGDEDADPASPEASNPDDATAAVLDAAARSTKARTRNLGAKITALVADLRQALAIEAGEAEARAEVDRLREQLRAAEAKLRTGRPATAKKSPAATGEEFPCPVDGCDKTFTAKQGLTMHNTRVHREVATA